MNKIIASIFTVLVITNLNSKINNSYIEAGVNYNFWMPSGLNSFNVQTFGFNNAHFAVNLESEKLREKFPYLPQIPVLSIESNMVNRYNNELVSLKKTNTKDKYLQFLSIFSLKIKEIKIRLQYKHNDFISEVIANKDITYYSITKKEPVLFSENDILDFSTSYESFGIGIDIPKPVKGETGFADEDFGYLGLFYSTYKKPYTLAWDNSQISDKLFFSKFSGYGIEAKYRSSTILTEAIPTLDEFNAGFQIGLGNIELYKDVYFEDYVTLEKDDVVWYGDSYIDLKGSIRLKRVYITYAFEANYPAFVIANSNNEENKNRVNRPQGGLSLDLVLKPSVSLTYYF